ncbi:MAG TPA: hypothetical protein VFH99_00995 [Candidatus Saccharimonadales bacterium]|nr:hypothetical protein [Candidatus Saccharimonadales bacterium]
MNRRSIFIYTLIMVMASLLTFQVVAYALTSKSYMPSMPAAFKAKPKPTVASNFRCSNRPAIKGLEKAKDPQLRKLAEYQKLCHSAVTTHLMVFTQIPKDTTEAATMGKAMAGTLQEFNKFKVRPLIIVEPTADSTNLDWSQLQNGAYNTAIATYFQTIRSQGVIAQQTGVWVPLPEPNLPYWARGNTTPEDFAAIVNDYLSIAQQSFPGLEGSVMLNSATYSADDFDWANGEYVSLVPYVKNLNPLLVRSVGLQGFPWMPPANKGGAGIFDASEFLSYKLIKEAADTMKIKNVWFNTGTFSAKYTDDPTRQTYVNPERRTDVLNGIITQAQTLKKQGYHVSINLFSQDKSNASEATNWSYFSDSNVTTSPASPVFANFAARLQNNDIPLWLFDREGS